MDEQVDIQDSPQANAGCGTVAFSLGVLVLAAMALLLLPIGYLGLAIILGGLLFLSLIGFHYFVWAKWVLRSSDSPES